MNVTTMTKNTFRAMAATICLVAIGCANPTHAQQFRITTTTLPQPTINVPYPPTQINTVNGVPTYNFSDNSSLPPGLHISVDGVISGTPTFAGPYNQTVITVIDSAYAFAQMPYFWSDAPSSSPPANCNATATPPAFNSGGGLVTLTALCTSPSSGITYSWTRNPAPATPIAPGPSSSDTVPPNTSTLAIPYTYQVKACLAADPTNCAPTFSSNQVSVAGLVPPTCTPTAIPTSLPSGSRQVQLTSNCAPNSVTYTWTRNNAPIPNGNQANPVDTPPASTGSAQTTYTYRVLACLVANPTVCTPSPIPAAPPVTVAAQLQISPSQLPPGQGNVQYNQQLSAAFASGTVTWSIASGSLPTGINLDPITGLISGKTPTATTANVTVMATDSVGSTAKRVLHARHRCAFRQRQAGLRRSAGRSAQHGGPKQAYCASCQQ